MFSIPPEIIFTYYGFLLGFLVPVSMITTFYVLVLIRLNRIRRKHKSGAKQRSHRRVTRIVLAVITAYFICWVPYWFLQIFITIDPLLQSLHHHFSILTTNKHMRFLKELTHLTTIIGYANNCLNPVLYVFLSDSFREEYFMLLKCFNPGGIFMKYTSNHGNEPMNPHEDNASRQPSFQLVSPRRMGIKNLKHSVATEEVPSHYGSYSIFWQRSNDQKTQSRSTSSLRLNEPERTYGVLATSSRRSSLTRSLGNEKFQASIGNLLTLPNYSPCTITDDGGVYCGD